MPSSSSSFVAVQCFQCSTMQVKQQKKSGNKWTCVVCNHGQSMRKVFAQSHTAKDVRHFVQSFNMARKVADDAPQLEAEEAPDTTPHLDLTVKRLTDWSEYLDPQPPTEDTDEEQQIEIVTELPRKTFKRTKLTVTEREGRGGSGDKGPCKPFFSRRHDNSSRVKEPTTEKGVSSSKWSKYLESNDVMPAADDETHVDDMNTNVVLEYMVNPPNHETVADDDIHPDFL